MAKNTFPYELPENWQWTTLGNVAEIIMGQSPSGNDTTKDFCYTPLIGGANDMGELFPKITRYTRNPTKLSKPNDIIICVRATLGKPIFSDKEYCLGRGVAAIRLSSDSEKFFRYLFINFEQYFYDNATGSTFLQLSSEKLKKMPIPLPPLDEQKRIVAIIESLFEKLDEAKSIVQKIIDGYELRRAAILHKAFIGELTKNFRADSGLTLDDWQEKKLGEVLNLSKKKTDSFNENLKYVGLENISKDNGTINFQSAKDIKSTKNIFHGGDLLYGKLRPYLNKHGIPNFDGVCSTDILVLNANELSTNGFINYFFSLPTFIEYAVSNSKGINLPRVSAQIILQAEINLPPLGEQKEIVRVLDGLLDKERRTKEIAEKILSEIDLLKRTILARAFRGELGTNNPSEKLEGLY